MSIEIYQTLPFYQELSKSILIFDLENIVSKHLVILLQI